MQQYPDRRHSIRCRAACRLHHAGLAPPEMLTGGKELWFIQARIRGNLHSRFRARLRL